MLNIRLISQKRQQTGVYAMRQHLVFCFPRVFCIMLVFLLCGFPLHLYAQSDDSSKATTQAFATGVNMTTNLPYKFDTSQKFDIILTKQNNAQSISWLCYYGEDRSVLSLKGYDIFILEADALGTLTEEEKIEAVYLAYMSIGEIVQSRWFWSLVEDKPWLLGENPDWTGAFRVDPRSSEWGDLLVHTVAPALLAAGYDGFMLDNVDIGEYLENKDPALFEGARKAVAELIRRLRQNYPNAIIVANGGYSTVAEVAGSIDAVVCESTVSAWSLDEDGTFSYAEISPESKAWLRPRLLRLKGLGVPILALEYVDSHNIEEQQRVQEVVKKAGNHPYIAERNLIQLPSNDSLYIEK